MVQDLNKGITAIQYNSLNLPQQMDIKSPVAEARNEYRYTAGGSKLRVTQRWNPGYSTDLVIGTDINEASLDSTKVTDYIGNKVYVNGELEKILVDGGYYDVKEKRYYFYIQDHLGNNRVVADQRGRVVQRNDYYPFGMEFADNTNQQKQPYKYNGKELDRMHGLNWYDYSARHKDGERFTSVDPHAESYYSLSPYVYVMNNPMKYVDPTGKDTVPTNEIWDYYLVNFRTDGSAHKRSDNFYRMKVNGNIYHLHKVLSGENEGNYVAVLQHGQLELEKDGETQIVDIYEDKFIVGADRVNDFKSGQDRGDGYVYEFMKLAVDAGACPSTDLADMFNHHVDRIFSDPLDLIDNALNFITGIVIPKPKATPRKGWSDYYKWYFSSKGTKYTPLRGKDIKTRLRIRE